MFKLIQNQSDANLRKGKPFPKAFEMSDATKRVILSFVRDRIKPHLFIAAALFDHGLIALILILCGFLWQRAPLVLSLPVILPLLVIVASRQRGLQVLVHEGGHFNCCRWKWCNDILTDLLAGAPCFIRVRMYRISHFQHHTKLGGADDPDRQVHERHGLARLDRTSLGRYLATVRLGLYFFVPPTHSDGPDWRAIGQGLLWHVVFSWPLLAVFFGFLQALLFFVAFYLVPMFFIVPCIRYVAEAAKHQYDEAGDVVEATISNVGPIHGWLLHPHNDGFHLLHHLAPQVPFYHLPALHELMLVLELEQYAARCRVRRTILENPPRKPK